MLVVARGPISPSEARSLTESVNYDANVTWNERTKFDKFDNIGVLVISVAMLVVVLVGVALFGGFMVGGMRVWMRRGKPEGSQGDDFIKLDLKS
jgi:NAD/NADP transhydrogenase alpha subunit